MSAKPPFPDRRKILAASVAVAASSLIPAQAHAATTSEAIRPFHVNFPRAELSELRRRIKTVRWPDRETVADESQGIQLATIQEIARYWGDRLRLAEVRGETECTAAIHNPGRWAGHSFHSRSFET